MITIHNELLQYKGNFKSNHKKRIRPDTDLETEKNADLTIPGMEINDTNEFITGKVGYAVGVKALRHGFINIIQEWTDSHFTGRLMKLVTKIYMMDKKGITGKKSIFFSNYTHHLENIRFNIRENNIEILRYQFLVSHSLSRVCAKLDVKELIIKPMLIPRGATHYRILHHLSIVSDYKYSELNQRFEPLSINNALNAFAFSEYIAVGTNPTDDIEVSLPIKSDLSESDSVIQCIGIMYYIKSGEVDYVVMRGGGLEVMEVF